MDSSKVSAACEDPLTTVGLAVGGNCGEAGAGRVPGGSGARRSWGGVSSVGLDNGAYSAARRKTGKHKPVRKPIPSATVAVGGALLQVKSGRAGRPGLGGKRGKVHTFTRAARRRLLFLLNSINRDLVVSLPLFLTLTYPAVWDDDPELWKEHIERLWKRIQRRFPNAALVWRLEPQKRGAPHYHCLLFNVQFVEKEWLSAAWYEIVGSGDEKHKRFGSRVEQVKSWNGVNKYASKYVAKLPDEAIQFTNVGRWWGVKGRENLPVNFLSVSLNFPQFWFMRRVIRRYVRRAGVRLPVGRFAGASVFLPSTVSLKLLDYLTQELVQ